MADATDHYTLRGGGPRDVGAALHLPRLPLRRGRGLARPRRPSTTRGGRLPLRHAPHRLVRVLRRAGEPAPRERRLGHAGQLPRRPHRLPAARRAARLDRRPRGLRPDRLLPLRRRRLPHLVAGRPRRGAGATTGRPASSSRTSWATCGCGTAIWGDAAIAVPWAIFERYGDVGLLRTQYEHDALDRQLATRGRAPAAVDGVQLGDWLDPSAPPEDPSAGRTDPNLVANAWFCHTAP